MLYNLVEDIIGYTGTQNISSSTITNICGALIVLFWVMLFYFIFRTITVLLFK